MRLLVVCYMEKVADFDLDLAIIRCRAANSTPGNDSNRQCLRKAKLTLGTGSTYAYKSEKVEI